MHQGSPRTKRALEAYDTNTKPSGVENDFKTLNKRISRSASELSSGRVASPEETRPSSAAPTGTSSSSHLSIVQKTQTFLSQLKNRWARSKSRDRLRRKSPGTAERDSTDYLADLSSEHSSPNRQSPRHRVLNVSTDSPLSKPSRCHVDYAHKDEQNDIDFIPLIHTDDKLRQRELALRQHSFFQLRIHLQRGQNMISMDKNGLSDPYVKFKISGRLVYKSRTVYRDLNPVWDESFNLAIEDPFVPIHIKVFDYDWGLQDDFMGSVHLDLTTMDLGKTMDLVLPLLDSARPNTYLGEILLAATLWPKTQEDKDQKNSRLCDANRRLKAQIWSSVVTIALVEGRNLLAMDPETGTSDPYVKFRLGNEKYKSRVFWKSLTPRWLEQFDLHLYDDGDQHLEVTVWDKDRARDDFIGRCTINLSSFEREKTHGFWQELEDGAGSLYLLLTISGTTASETISDLTTYSENARERQNIEARYTMKRTFHKLKDVGHLTVKVFRASGLAAADLGGKSDPFCVLELGNARLQTQTEYKTLAPSWNKIFTFNVKDITNDLEVTVYDEDRDYKVEFLGKLVIPLLNIRDGERRWYPLKDKKLRARAKGANPQILLEMNILWNPLRACVRSLNPKEEKYMQTETKFKRQIFVRNVVRLKSVAMYFIDCGKIVQSWFEWESKISSLFAFVVWLLICYYFEPWMLPAACLLIFVKEYILRCLTGASNSGGSDDMIDSDGDEDDDDEKEKEEKKTLKEKLQAVQEVTQSVQNYIGYIASLCEAVKNTFNFTVPFLSWIAVSLLIGASVVLYLIPLRYLLMGWVINKFTRRLLRPHSVPNNEVLDLLSRVPDDETLLDYRELKLLVTNEMDKRKDQRKKPKSS